MKIWRERMIHFTDLVRYDFKKFMLKYGTKGIAISQVISILYFKLIYLGMIKMKIIKI